MSVVGTARRVRKRVRPLRSTLEEVREHASRSSVLAILESPAGRALASRLGVTAGEAPAPDGLLVHVAAPGEHSAAPAARLAAHRAGGGRVLVLLTGGPAERATSERALLAEGPFAPYEVVRVQGGAAGDAAVQRVVVALGEDAVAAGAAVPELREPVARHLIASAARRAGAVGVVGFLPGAEMSALVAQQVRLVGQIAALHGRPLGRERALEVAGVVAAGFGWRGLARTAIRQLPGARLVVRGGFAYAATRSTGEAALRWFASPASARAQGSLVGALKGALGRGGRG